jgi:LysM repeat protein
MSLKSLPTKRINTRKYPVGGKILRAVTGRRKRQRVAATTARAGDFDDHSEEDSGTRISRVLTIIFLIHILAIGAIFFHQLHLKERLDGNPPAATAESTSSSPPPPADPLPRLSTGEAPYIVARGDNYARIATALDVDEADLRRANDNVEIRPGLLLKIPPKRIIAAEPPELATRRNNTPAESQNSAASNPATDGLVEAIDPSDRSPQLVRPNVPRATPVNDPAAASGGTRTHTVKAGETIWRISNQYKVDQEAIMRANNITDPRRIQPGMKLVIP